MSELPFLRDLVVLLLLSLAIVLIFRRLRQPSVVGFLAAVLTLQSLTGVAAVWGLGLGLRASVLAGLAVAQVGEFSFVLAQAGFALGVLDAAHYQVFLRVAVTSMFATGFLFAAAGPPGGSGSPSPFRCHRHRPGPERKDPGQSRRRRDGRVRG